MRKEERGGSCRIFQKAVGGYVGLHFPCFVWHQTTKNLPWGGFLLHQKELLMQVFARKSKSHDVMVGKSWYSSLILQFSVSSCVSAAAGNSFSATSFATEKKSKGQTPQQLEMKSDKIEFELFFHMLLLFSASPLVFSPPGFRLSSAHLAAQFVHHPLKWFTDAKRWIYSASFALVLWFFRGSARFLLFLSLARKHKWIIYGALVGFAEKPPPPAWGKCHSCSLWCSPLF